MLMNSYRIISVWVKRYIEKYHDTHAAFVRDAFPYSKLIYCGVLKHIWINFYHIFLVLGISEWI